MDLGLIKSFLELRKPEELHYLDNSKESHWIRNHYDNYGALPLPATFEKEFECVLPDFCEDWEYYKQNLIDEDYIKKAAPLLEEFNAKATKLTPKEALVWLRDELAAVESKQKLGMGTSIINTMPSLIEHFLKSGVRYPIGIKPFDDVSGGVGSDDILILTARPGQGKSMLATFVASNLSALGLRVGFYSSEMKYRAIQARFASFTGGFSNFAITRGRDVKNWEDYIDSLQDWQGEFIVLMPRDLGGRFATPQDIQAFIVAKNIDVMVIDQINGMSLTHKGSRSSNDWTVLADLQMKLTEIQKSLGIPFIEVLQLNREASKDTEPDLSNIAGADRFGQDASAVLGLWRKAKDIAMLKVLKSRDFDGEGLKWEFTVDFDKGKILPRTNSVSAVKNAIQINQSKTDDDILD